MVLECDLRVVCQAVHQETGLSHRHAGSGGQRKLGMKDVHCGRKCVVDEVIMCISLI